LEPNERITAGFFVKKAEEAIEDIYRRSKIPVITCGTGFYLKAFLYGMYSVPEVDSEIKDKLQKMTREERWELLLAKDKIATESIGFADDYRVMRALEVILSGNIKWSEIKQSKLEGFLDLKKPDVTGMLIYRERQELYDRINQRCKQMIESGILEETKEVVVKYGENAPALNSLGYNFALDYINGKMSMESFLEEFSRSHRNYAKKQITWFKKERVLDTMNWATALEKIKNI